MLLTATTSTSSRTASPMPLDPETLHILRSSAAQLALLGDDFVAGLYQDVLALSSGVASSVAEEGRPACDRIARAVLWVAQFSQPPEPVAAVLRQVGADNWREGFPDAAYVSVAQALVRTVRGTCDTDWSTSIGSAWISCFQWMRPHLLAGARLAAAESSGTRSPAFAGQPQMSSSSSNCGPGLNLAGGQADEDLELAVVLCGAALRPEVCWRAGEGT